MAVLAHTKRKKTTHPLPNSTGLVGTMADTVNKEGTFDNFMVYITNKGPMNIGSADEDRYTIRMSREEAERVIKQLRDSLDAKNIPQPRTFIL